MEVRDCASLEDLFLERALRAPREPIDLHDHAFIEPVGALPIPDLYAEFLRGLPPLHVEGPVSEPRIMEAFGIERSQARKGLTRAVAEGRVEKIGRPVRYRILDS